MRVNSKRGKPAAKVATEPTVVLTEQAEAANPKLPHERDESPELPAKPDPKIVQAEQDLSAGQQDTDRRNEAANTYARNERQRR